MTLENYFAPKSVKEAISLLSEYGQKARVISGGTDLLAQMKHREVLPQCVISIGNIAELSYIKYDESKGLNIGVLTSVVDIANSPVVKSKFSILAQAAGLLGTPSIRNQATLGGNLCNAAPSADTAPPLLVLEAKAKIAGAKGEKMVPLERFFAGPGQTILEQGQSADGDSNTESASSQRGVLSEADETPWGRSGNGRGCSAGGDGR